MRCREARSRLNDLAKDGHSQADPELLAHLKECPACARQAQAARELQQAFSALETEDVSDAVAWSEQVRRVEAQVTLYAHRKENPMSALKKQFRLRPRLGYSLVAVLALVLAVTVIPLKFDQTVGFEVAVAGVSKDLAFDTYRIQELLNRLGVTDASVNVTGCEETCNLKITSLKSPEDAAMVKVAFEELSEGTGMKTIVVELNSVDCEVSSNALGYVTKTFIAKSSTDPNELVEVREMVAQKLEGFDGKVFFYCDTLADGAQQIQIVTGPNDAGDFQWTGAVTQSQTVADGLHGMTWVGDCSAGEMQSVAVGPDHIVDGHLTSEARAALEAQGFTVQENIDSDGATHVTLVKSVNGEDQTIELKFKNDGAAQVDEAAKDATDDLLPEGYGLSQNYPNPFNPITQIEYSLPSAQHVSIEIYNINGQRVRTLVDETMGPGSHIVQWDATDDHGSQVASGVYLYRFSAGEVTQTKKMSFVK